MKSMSRAALTLFAASFAFTTCLTAQEITKTGTGSGATNASDLISTYQAQQEQADMANAPVKSPSDLSTYESEHVTSSPLNALSPMMKQLFVNSIRYNEKGVTTIRYDVLESLSPTQVYQILSLFGMQSLTPSLNLRSASPLDKQIMSLHPNLMPLKGYYCEGKGTCRQNASEACSDAC